MEMLGGGVMSLLPSERGGLRAPLGGWLLGRGIGTGAPRPACVLAAASPI